MLDVIDLVNIRRIERDARKTVSAFTKLCMDICSIKLNEFTVLLIEANGSFMTLTIFLHKSTAVKL